MNALIVQEYQKLVSLRQSLVSFRVTVDAIRQVCSGDGN